MTTSLNIVDLHMKFRTVYNPESSAKRYDSNSADLKGIEYPVIELSPELPVLLMGSCFSTEIGNIMKESLWDANINPTGVLYNPESIADVLDLALSSDSILSDKINDSIVKNGDIYSSLLCDSGASSYSYKETYQRVTDKFTQLRDSLAIAQSLIVSFGTAWIYQLKDTGITVTNCHKLPASIFVRKRLTVHQIIDRWLPLIHKLKNEYPRLKLIFTVSPIRHLKDGFEGNSLSKAILRLAVDELCNNCNKATYFPSFEILLDDLRDYRFYASDMIHPSETAVEYIWQNFCRLFIPEEGRRILEEGKRIRRALNHRPVIKDSSVVSESMERSFHEKALSGYHDFISRHPGMLKLQIS